MMDSFTNVSISNMSSPATTADPYSADLDDKWQRILLAVICLFVSFTGIFGNAIILLSVGLSKKLRSPTNVFVVTLSVADLLTCLAIPWNVVALLSFEGWPIADWICSAAAVALYVPTFCSVLTLASIGINRLVIITRPVHVYQKIFCTKVLCVWIAFLWIWPFILSAVPPLAGFGALGYNERFHSCSSVSANPYSDQYDLLITILIYPFPLLTILVVYIWIFIHVRNKAVKLTGPMSPTEDSVTNIPPAQPSPSPTTPKSISICPISPGSFTQSPTSPRFVSKSPTSPRFVTKSPTSPESVTLSPTSPKLFTKSPTSTKTFDIPSSTTTASTNHHENGPIPRSTSLSAVPSRILEDREARPLSLNFGPTKAKIYRGGSLPLKKVPATRGTEEDAAPMNRNRNGLSLSKRFRNTIKEVIPLNHISRRQLAITKNMFYVVVAYIICLTPFVFCVQIDTDVGARLLPYASVGVFFNSCINPLIYATKHPNFKKIFSYIVRCQWHEIPEPSDTLRALRQRGLCNSK